MKLKGLGCVDLYIKYKNKVIKNNFIVVPQETMSYDILFGRGSISLFNMGLVALDNLDSPGTVKNDDDILNEAIYNILQIDYSNANELEAINLNSNLSQNIKDNFNLYFQIVRVQMDLILKILTK